MSAALFVGRVGGIAAALGVGVAILQGTAVAGAETGRADSSSGASDSAGASDSNSASPRAARTGRGSAAATVSSRNDSPAVSADLTLDEVIDPAPVDDSTFAADAPSALPAPAATTLTLPAPSATVPAPSATTDTVPVASTTATATVVTPPNPDSTVETPYGPLGQWMINKDGEVADWIGQPYCGPGSTVGNCGADTPGAKKIQEPINTIFVVKARTQYEAELQLNWSLVVSGFGPSPFSSIGYSGILGTTDYKQMPRGGPLGLGLLLPLPFGLFQDGLTGSLLGVGAAYRDNPFFLANSHLRTFGAEPDGKGNYIFTASVSEENLDPTGGGLLPTHGYESFDQARTKLTSNMLKASWISFASDGGMVAMDNEIAASDPTYTTGDHDGLAQVIVIGSLFGMGQNRTNEYL